MTDNSKPTEMSIHSARVKKVTIVSIGAIVVLSLIGLLAYLSVKLFQQGSGTNSGNVSQHQKVENDGNAIVTKEEGDVAGLVEKVGPSVVSIVTKTQAPSRFGLAEEEGAGTGIVVGKEGFILTNKHVVKGADTVGVVLSDGTRHENVKVLGVDPLNDVAFLKIDGVNNLPAAELGDSSSIRVGQRVVAIGNSLGQYQNTVTSGIISGIGRPITAQSGETVESLSDLIQTDAAINPGNSGGPLLNINGQVIGINTAIVEDAQGIGFSIPVNATKGMLKSVLANKPVERAYLGLNFIPVTADVAKYYNLPVKKGAYVSSSEGRGAVVADGPAAKAGIRDGDIITKVGGVEVGPGGGVASLIGEYAPGETVQVELLRSGQITTVRVTLAAYKG
jgi:serine protease Do